MRRQTMLGVMLVVVLLMSASVNASTITFYGSDLNSGAADWRTATVAKPLDADNIYGTDGWVTWKGLASASRTTDPANDCRISDLPDCVGSFTEIVSPGVVTSEGTFFVEVVRYDGYAMIDDPNSPSVDYESHSMSARLVVDGAATPGVELECLSFTVDSDCSFTFGVMADTLNQGKFTVPGPFNSISYTLASSSGNTYEISLDTTSGFDLTPDMYFFQVDGAVAGETFTLSGESGYAGNTTLAAVTWDNVAVAEVPEPSTIVLLLAGWTLLVVRRGK